MILGCGFSVSDTNPGFFYPRVGSGPCLQHWLVSIAPVVIVTIIVDCLKSSPRSFCIPRTSKFVKYSPRFEKFSG